MSIQKAVDNFVAQLIYSLASAAADSYLAGTQEAGDKLGRKIDPDVYRARAKARAAKYAADLEADKAIMNLDMPVDGCPLRNAKAKPKKASQVVPWLEPMKAQMTTDLTVMVQAGDTKAVDQYFDAWKGRADLIALMSTTMIAFDGQFGAFSDEGVNGMEWVCGGNPCAFCEEHDGNVYALDECPDLPVHPNCECDVKPVAL